MKKSVVYTGGGDRGTTSLVGGERIDKDASRLEAYGSVDELNSWIGLLAAEAGDDADTVALLAMVQNRLFDIGAYLATRNASEAVGLTDGHIAMLEHDIDRMDSALTPLRCFVLPGGTTESAHAHIARTVCRRAERRIVGLGHEAAIDPRVLKFINRLSDWAFVYSRHLNAVAGVADVAWSKE